MSVDLSDPEIARVKDELLEAGSPTTWFLCHYSPSATSPALALVGSGPDPVVPQWAEQLNGLKSKGDEVAFGYGEFKGKGCVIHYLTDKMGGVKRARAVVHSRAFASLFPDYSALITIADPVQLTQELINEKLGLNYVVKQAHPARPVQATTTEYMGNESALLHSAKRDTGTLPPTPQTVPQTVPTPRAPEPPQPSPHQAPAQSSSFPTTQQTPPSGISPSHARQPSASSQQRSRHVSESGSGSEGNPNADRQRKVSLTARLGKAFGNPAMQGRTSDPPAPSSPGSPASGSKFKTSITKAFRRTSADTPPVTAGARADSPAAPPVPPKDEASPQTARRPSDVSSPGQYRTPSGGVGYSPSSAVPSPRSDSLPPNVRPIQANGSPSASLTPSNVATQNHSTPLETRLSPSPSAQRVFTEARMKSVSQEEEIQNRFRRDLHLDDSAGASQPVVDLNDDTEEDLRLPYDVSDDRLSDKHTDDPSIGAFNDPGMPAGVVLGPPIGAVGEGRSESLDVDDRPQQDPGEVSGPPLVPAVDQEVERQLQPAAPAHSNEAPVDGPTTRESDARGLEGTESSAAVRQQDVEENRHQEEQRLRAAEEADRRAKEEEEERQRTAAEEAERVRRQAEEAERVRKQAEEAERVRLETEEAEQARLRAETERKEEEARLVREAEERRLREEEEARRKEEEEEKLRLALEEQKRIEAVRAREEEERRRVEEERRVVAEKAEAERVRKESIKQSLRGGKSSGGVMLRGYVTVQTTKSLIWRRRYFHLLSGEVRLYKGEGDEKPMQTIYLGPKAKIEHAYEESQVQGSWKIVSDGQDGREEFFVFADSPEEKETILEGLQMAIL